MQHKIKRLIDAEGLTTSRFAEQLSIQASGVSHILSGRNKPSFELLQRILTRFPRVNPDWLLMDSEQMYRSQGGDSTEATAGIQPSAPSLPFEQVTPSQPTQASSQDAAEPTMNFFDNSLVASRKEANQGGAPTSPQQVVAAPPTHEEQHKLEAPNNASNIVETAPRAVIPLPPRNGDAQVEKVLLIYSDGTFESYKIR